MVNSMDLAVFKSELETILVCLKTMKLMVKVLCMLVLPQ